jgi:hypothetical protein
LAIRGTTTCVAVAAAGFVGTRVLRVARATRAGATSEEVAIVTNGRGASRLWLQTISTSDDDSKQRHVSKILERSHPMLLSTGMSRGSGLRSVSSRQGNIPVNRHGLIGVARLRPSRMNNTLRGNIHGATPHPGLVRSRVFAWYPTSTCRTCDSKNARVSVAAGGSRRRTYARGYDCSRLAEASPLTRISAFGIRGTRAYHPSGLRFCPYRLRALSVVGVHCL